MHTLECSSLFSVVILASYSLFSYISHDLFIDTDENECINGQSTCSIFADCINLPGTYGCQCKDGYMGDGYHCTLG